MRKATVFSRQCGTVGADMLGSCILSSLESQILQESSITLWPVQAAATAVCKLALRADSISFPVQSAPEAETEYKADLVIIDRALAAAAAGTPVGGRAHLSHTLRRRYLGASALCLQQYQDLPASAAMRDIVRTKVHEDEERCIVGPAAGRGLGELV